MIEQAAFHFEIPRLSPEQGIPAEPGLLSGGIPLSAVLPSVLLVLLLIAIALMVYKRRDLSGAAALRRKLAEYDERFQTLVLTSNDWIWEVDADMLVTYCSPQILSILGYSPQEVLGKRPFDYMPAEESARVRSIVDEAVRRKGPFWKVENECVAKDGRRVYLESNGTPLLDERGGLRGYRGVNHDITARRLAERASEEYRRRMESLISNLFGVAYRCLNTPDWPIEFISRGCVELTGYAPVDFISRRVLLNDLIHRDDRRRVWEQVQQALSDRLPFNLEYRMIHRSGKVRWVVERGCGIWDQDRLEALEGLIVDITDHKLAQQQLQQSREFLESVIRSVPTGISVTIDRVYVSVNDRFCQMFGYSRDELIGRSTRMIHPSQQSYDDFGKLLYEPMQREGTATAEVRFLKKDGMPLDVLMSGAPIDRTDWSKGITFCLLDITERKRVSEQLALRLRLERLVSDISGGFVNLPVEHIDEQVNRSLRMLVERLGLERVRLALIAHETGKLCLSPYFHAASGIAVFSQSDDLDRDMPEYAAVIRENRIVWWQTPDSVPEELRGVRQFFAEHSILSHLCIPMTVGQDHVGALMITNVERPLSIDPDLLGYLRVVADTLANALVRKSHLLAIEESERRFRSIIESSPMAILAYQLFADGRLIFTGTNPAASKILNIDVFALVNKSIEEAFGQLEPALVETYKRIARDGGSYRGSNYVYQDDRVSGIYDFEAFQTSPGKIAIMFSDVTERRRAEQAREHLMRQLRSKNEELEGLVYIASHDLRSPLVNIRGFSGELEKSLADLRAFLAARSFSEADRRQLEQFFAAEFAEALGFINSGTSKMESMLDGLLRLSRIGAAQIRPERIQLDTLLEQVIRQFKFTLKAENIAIEIAGDLPDCMGDRLLVGQVFSNLIDNAIKYRSPARPLKLRIEGSVIESQVEYRVIDNGIGIAREHIHKVFDIFHQLNPSAKSGQGLGLTIVRKILEKQDGRVWLASTLNAGTTVFIRLPGA